MKTSNYQVKTHHRTIILAVALLISSPSVFSQKDESVEERIQAEIAKKKHAISMCPGGIAFGIFSANYQQMLRPNQSLVFRVDYEAVPKTYTDANIESNGWALILNYRYHFKPSLNSYYVGAFGRYRKYHGDGKLASESFDFKIPECTIGLNLGRRWVWKSGFTLNFALGYGYQYDELKLDKRTPEVEDAIDDFKDDYDFFNGFLGEFSIGYAF